jgi:N-acetylglucosamine kinase-like BadF-type ATPase
MRHVVGIDVGGTKTVCLLAEEHGDVIAEARAGGANLQVAGDLHVERVLHAVLSRAIGREDCRPAAICIGIAGADRQSDAETVRAILRRIGVRADAVVVNDALIALTAGVGDDEGVVVVAGTGSISYGRNRAGDAARAGGWGPLLGDEGSGFWIGRAVLDAVVRQHDGRGRNTLLTALALRELGLGRPSDLTHAVYGREFSSHAIAGLAGVLREATDARDPIAIEILRSAGVELAALAKPVTTRLGLEREAFPTILSGGIFQELPELVQDVSERIRQTAPLSDVRLLDREPALGAVHLARAALKGSLRLCSYIESPGAELTP